METENTNITIPNIKIEDSAYYSSVDILAIKEEPQDENMVNTPPIEIDPLLNLSLLQPVRLGNALNRLECNTCNKTFSKLDHLKRHALIHTGIKPYKCDQCEMAFHRRDKLKRHQFIHTGVKDHKCHLCSKEFYRSDKLKDHLLKHHDIYYVNMQPLQSKPADAIVRPHVCHQCNKSYSRAEHLKRHILTHSNVRPYCCEHCDKKFYRLDQLKNHTVTHFKVSLHTCIHCDKSFNSTELFQAHMLSHLDYGHFMDIVPSALNIPSNSKESEVTNEESTSKTYIQLNNVNSATTITFVDMKNIVNNEETNNLNNVEIRRFPCEQCDKVFKRADHLKRHLLTHTDGPAADLECRNFPCTQCTKSFKRPDHLKRHLKLHADNELKCEFCRASFNTKAILEMHKLEHANEKLHYCGQCSRSFNKLKLLTNHLQTHWTVTPVANS